MKAAKIQVIAISYDKVKILDKFAKKFSVTFPVLSDPDSKVIKAYKIYNQAATKRAFTKGVPYPGTFVLDENGIIRAKLFLEGYRDRHTTKALIDAVSNIK